jgi:hypothetical protein
MKIPSLRSLGAALLLAGALSSTASAELIAEFNTTTTIFGNPSAGPVDWADHANKPTSFGPAAGSGLTRSTDEQTYNFLGWDTTINTGKYVGFTIAPEAGYTLNLTDLSFNGSGATANYGAPYVITSFQWGYRVDANNDGTFDGGWTFSPAITSADPDFTANNVARSWDFADFSSTGKVEFGFFATGIDPLARAEMYRVATLNGSVTSAVPEPSTYGMIVAAGAVALVIVRRRNKAFQAL